MNHTPSEKSPEYFTHIQFYPLCHFALLLSPFPRLQRLHQCIHPTINIILVILRRSKQTNIKPTASNTHRK